MRTAEYLFVSARHLFVVELDRGEFERADHVRGLLKHKIRSAGLCSLLFQEEPPKRKREDIPPPRDLEEIPMRYLRLFYTTP